MIEAPRNCWRVERADRFACIQDAADYFRLVRDALLAARHSVLILGWDISARIDLVPGAPPSDAPTRLDHLLKHIARRRPSLRCDILTWDYGALYTLERDPFTRWELGWRTPRGVRFDFDDHHPVGASHHQKIIVVDDLVAFCGGVDLTGHRWDTPAHDVTNPHRTTAMGDLYGPYHEIQAAVSGPAARALGELARERWRTRGVEIPAPQAEAGPHDPWPHDLKADLTNVDVGIARTMPATETQTEVRECEALFRDSIEQAKHAIYIESQYFTSDTLADALAARLGERDGPELIVVVPKECHGWLEQNTMGAFRAAAFRKLIAADAHHRLRIVFPLASRQHDVPTFVHSKVMIVDDVLARIGSANFSERSLGLDTECDLAADAGEDGDRRAGVLRIRNRLLGEHLGMSSEDVAREIEQRGSMRALIDARKDAERTLVLIDLTKAPTEESPLLREVADPGAPISLAEPIAAAVPQGGVLANALRTLLGVLPGSPRVSRDRARAQFW